MKKAMKNLISGGIATMGAGMALGTMDSMPGMPAQAKTTTGIVMTGMNLGNIGNLAKVGMNIMPKGSKKMKW